jgi:hypothetical protein
MQRSKHLALFARPQDFRKQAVAGDAPKFGDPDSQAPQFRSGKALKFAPQGIEPLTLTSAEFDALIRREIVSNIKLAKAAGLKL